MTQTYKSGIITIRRIQGRDWITAIVRGAEYAASSINEAKRIIAMRERK
jgi:hypothetical protein